MPPPAAMPPAERPRRSSTFELSLPPIQRIIKLLGDQKVRYNY
jgi:histone H3/H4